MTDYFLGPRPFVEAVYIDKETRPRMAFNLVYRGERLGLTKQEYHLLDAMLDPEGLNAERGPTRISILRLRNKIGAWTPDLIIPHLAPNTGTPYRLWTRSALDALHQRLAHPDKNAVLIRDETGRGHLFINGARIPGRDENGIGGKAFTLLSLLVANELFGPHTPDSFRPEAYKAGWKIMTGRNVTIPALRRYAWELRSTLPVAGLTVSMGAWGTKNTRQSAFYRLVPDGPT